MKSDDIPAIPQKNIVFEERKVEKKSIQVLPEWKVSGVFSSHMVLQRERPITVWGWSCHIGAAVSAVCSEAFYSGSGSFGGGLSGGQSLLQGCDRGD